MGKPKLWTKDFISISLSNFFVFLTFYYLLVTLPVYALTDMHSNELEAGLVVTVFLISAIIIRPFAGRWLETIGKRKVLLAFLIILMGASCFYFLTDSIMSLLVLRFIHGIGFGMATTAAGGIVSSIIPESRKGEGMGYFVLSTNLAMVIGPFLGLTALHYAGINLVFIISVICGIFALVAGFFINIPTIAKTEPMSQKKQFTFKDIIEVSALRISVVGAFFAIVYSSILSFVSVYAGQIGLVEVSSFFFVIYAVILLLSRPFTGKWYDLYGASFIIYPCIFIFAVGMLILSTANSAFAFLLAAGLIGLGWGTLFPSFQTIAIQKAGPNRGGTATATFLSIFDIGISIGSSIVALISANIGFDSFYFYSAFYILIGFGVYYLLHDRKNRKLQKQTKDVAA